MADTLRTDLPWSREQYTQAVSKAPERYATPDDEMKKRREFIRAGIINWGIPVALVTGIWVMLEMWVMDFGDVPLWKLGMAILAALPVMAIIGVVTGWAFGVVLWRLMRSDRSK